MNMNRLRFAVRWAFRHFLVSAVVVSIVSILVFVAWYPSPWRNILGVTSVFWLVVAADLVCGPILTLILASPLKSARERWLDLALVALIQIGALGYGIWTVGSARPVLLVFEVDRLFVVTANEVQDELLHQAPESLKRLSWIGVARAGLREAQSSEEYLNSVAMSLSGVTQAMRPNWWIPYGEEVKSAMRKKARPLTELLQKRPNQLVDLNKAIDVSGQSADALFYLPLTSSKNSEWVALIDAAGEMVGYAPVDGFD